MTFNNPVKGSWLNVVSSFIRYYKKFSPLKKKGNISHYAKIKKYMTIDIHKAIAKLPIITEGLSFQI